MSRLRALLLAAVVLAAVGCGESPPPRPAPSSSASSPATPAPGRPAPKGRGPLLVAALGDSITAGAPRWDPDPAIREALGERADPRSQYEFWARRRLGARVLFRNCGVSGETTEQIARRLDACAGGARALIVQGGINDIAQGLSVEEAALNLERMVRRGRSLGLRVALAELLPWNDGYPEAAPAIARLNRLIGAIARRQRVALLRFHRALEDSRRPGRMRPDWTSDGDHPSIGGYRRLGEVVEVP